MFKKEEIPLRDIIEEDRPEILPNFDGLIKNSQNGTVESKYSLAAVMYVFVTHPIYARTLPHMTEKIAYRTLDQSLQLLQDGIAQNHAESIHIATYITIATARTPQDLDKADALFEKIRDSREIDTTEKEELEKVLRKNRRDMGFRTPAPSSSQPPTPPPTPQ